MADTTAKVAVHKTLTANAVDAVTLTEVKGPHDGAQPYRWGRDLLRGLANRRRTQRPTAGPNDTYVVPAAISSVPVSVKPGVAGNAVVVKLISTGAEAYSAEAL